MAHELNKDNAMLWKWRHVLDIKKSEFSLLCYIWVSLMLCVTCFGTKH